MKNVSSAFKNEIENGNRNYVKSVKLALNDGTELMIDNSKLWQNGLKIESATSNQNSFDIGATIIGQLTLTLNNITDEYSGYDFTDCTATNVKVGLKLPDGTTESLSYGKFYLNEAKYNGSIITLTFYDGIYKFDQPYSKSSLSYPATLRQIVQDACSVCGVTLGTATFDQDDFVVQERPDDSSITFRQVLQWVGQIACYYFYADSQGRLSMKWYDLSAFEDADNIFLEDSDGNFVLDAQEDKIFTFIENGTTYPGTTMPYHNLASFVSLNTGLDDVVITGIKVIQEVDGENGGKEESSYQSGNDGYVLAVSKNKLIQGDSGNTIASLLGTKIIGMRFRTFSASGLSDPTIEAGDPVVLIDRKGNSYQSYITNNVFQPGAYQSTSLGAETPARKSATRYSQISQVYVDYRKELQKERDEREQALDELGEQIKGSGGLFTTIETQADGSKKYFMHNKPVLSESDIIWSMTAEAWGVSTDGGKTYNAGMTVDGDTIVRILTATGVNADWIDTGAITVRDNDGNVIFSVDMDTKQVIISGDKMVIGGRPATEVIQDAIDKAEQAEETANKAKILALTLTNDYQSIPVDSGGNYEEFPECTTTAIAMYGNTDVTSSCVFSVEKSTSITGSWDAGTKTYTVIALSQDDGWVDITATYLNTLTVTKRFTVAKLYAGKSGESYTIEASDSIIKIGSSGLNPMAVTFRAYKNTEDGRTAYQGRFMIEENRGGVGWESVYFSESDESEITWEFIDAITTAAGLFIQTASGKNIVGGQRMILGVRCTLFLSGSTTQTIDAIDIPVVKDLDALTHEEVFNLLTNFGQIQGIYQEGNQIYINATYIKSGTMSADLIKGGTLELGGNNNQNAVLIIKNASGAEIGRWDKDGFRATVGVFSGELQAASGTFSGNLSAAGGTFKGNLSAAGGTFKGNLSAAGGTFSGNLSAVGGTFSGDISGSNINGSIISGSRFDSYITGSTLGVRIAVGNIAMYWPLASGNEQIARIGPSHIIYNGVDYYGPKIAGNGEIWLEIDGSDSAYFLNDNTIFFNKVTARDGLAVLGTKQRLVKTNNFGDRAQYCYETATPYFGDIGTGKLNDEGECYISIDEIFAETISNITEYSVFLQKEGQGDIWVDSKEPTFFVVKGTPGLAFSWEIKAAQKDYEQIRLADDDLENNLAVRQTNDVKKIFDEQFAEYQKEIEEMFA